MIDEGWNYFYEDSAYADELTSRLYNGVEMNSAIGIGKILQDRMNGDLKLIDFGSGPGHYFPVIEKGYKNGLIQYQGVDIIPSSIETGNLHFSNRQNVNFSLGSVLEPEKTYQSESMVISANTLPHIPSISPLLQFIKNTTDVKYFLFRMLIGEECIETRKHLKKDNFNYMFEQNYQFNNIYSIAYMQSLLGENWALEVIDDFKNTDHLSGHKLPYENTDPFYRNRVSHQREGMVFKGDVYMPWKFIFGCRTL
jgi:hypothetical protein